MTTPAAPPLTSISVLSIRQPWLGMILAGQKWVENRSWQRATLYRGELFLHASRWESRPPTTILKAEPWLAALWDDPHPLCRPIGQILGSVNLVYAANQHDSIESYHVHARQSSRQLTPHQAGLLPFLPPLNNSPSSESAWKWWDSQGMMILREPRVLREPIPTGGRLNIWKFPVDPSRLTFLPPESSESSPYCRRRRKSG